MINKTKAKEMLKALDSEFCDVFECHLHNTDGKVITLYPDFEAILDKIFDSIADEIDCEEVEVAIYSDDENWGINQVKQQNKAFKERLLK